MSCKAENRVQIQHDPLKRIFDILFSVSALLFLLPFMILIALLVKLSSKGPIFYESVRLGRGAKPIRCLKFRTMYKDAEERLQDLLESDPKLQSEWKIYQKLQNDPRITPFGKFLRKSSLDELPQFWNVLKGDLSVVGPRPPTLIGPSQNYWKEIRKLYGEDAQIILTVRPGITGVWQISGRSSIPMEERCRLEADYALNRSFFKDLLLIIKTIPAILFSKGAC